jgi:ABC-2 type transport system permease protein
MSSAYWHIISARFRTLLQYRGAALGGLATQGFFGVVRIMILEAFYRSSTGPQPMSFAETVGYVWMGQAMLVMLPWNVDRDIRDQIREGSVVFELCRPLDLYALWYCRAVAWRTAPMLMRLLPMFAVAGLVLPAVGLASWSLEAPATPAAGALWLATMGGALLLSCAITTLMNISLIWTTSSQGIAILVAGLATIFSGLVIPLPLFPDWAQTVMWVMPFSGVLDLPSRIWVGHIPADQAGWVLVHQLAWTVLLVALGRWVLARGTRRLVVHGG